MASLPVAYQHRHCYSPRPAFRRISVRISARRRERPILHGRRPHRPRAGKNSRRRFRPRMDGRGAIAALLQRSRVAARRVMNKATMTPDIGAAAAKLRLADGVQPAAGRHRVSIGNHFLFLERLRKGMRRVKNQFDFRTFRRQAAEIPLHVGQQLADVVETAGKFLRPRPIGLACGNAPLGRQRQRVVAAVACGATVPFSPTGNRNTRRRFCPRWATFRPARRRGRRTRSAPPAVRRGRRRFSKAWAAAASRPRLPRRAPVRCGGRSRHRPAAARGRTPG